MQPPRRARPFPCPVAAPRRAGRTAPGRAGQRPRKAGRARRRTRSGTACGHKSMSCCRTRTSPSSKRSRRRWSRSWRRWVRCRPCSRGGSRSPPGVLRAPIVSRSELFEERRSADGGLGLALIRDGNGARSFETLLRYRGAAMAEFWRALRTLKALQAEQAQQAQQALGSQTVLAAEQVQIAARPALAPRQLPNEPERAAEPGWITCRATLPRRLPCMSPPRPGCRTNPRTTPIGALLTRTSWRARWNQRPRSARGQHQIRALLADHDAAASALPRGPDQPRQGEGPRISAGLWATRAGDRADGSPGHHISASVKLVYC